jgi:hypothetical protein
MFEKYKTEEPSLLQKRSRRTTTKCRDWKNTTPNALHTKDPPSIMFFMLKVKAETPTFFVQIHVDPPLGLEQSPTNKGFRIIVQSMIPWMISWILRTPISWKAMMIIPQNLLTNEITMKRNSKYFRKDNDYCDKFY